MYIRSGFIQGFFASIESSFRIYYKEISPSSINNAAGEFKNIYYHLFSKKSLNLPNYKALLDLWRLIRNTKHNNGIFYPRSLKDCELEYKQIKYKFEVGKRPSFITWDFLLYLIPDTKDMLLAVVNSHALIGVKKNILEN